MFGFFQHLPSNSSKILRGICPHHVLLDGERFALRAGDEHEGQEAVHVRLEGEEEEETFLHQTTTIISPVFADGRCGRTHQNVEDLVDVLPSDLDTVYLQDLIPFRKEAAPLGCTAPDDATDDHAVHLIANGGALRDATAREQAMFGDFTKNPGWTDNNASIGC